MTLTINKGTANEKVIYKQVSVYPKPNPSVEGKEGCAPFTTTLTAVATPVTIDEFTIPGTAPSPLISTVGAITGGIPKTYIWNFFGVLPSVTQTTPDLTLNNIPAGNYDVLLTVIDEHGCSSSVYKQGVIRVNPKPVANDFTFVKSNACGLGAVAFTGSASVATGTIAGYAWDFDDPTSGSNLSGLQNPSHTFVAAGTHSVSYTASSASGCTSDPVTKDIIFNDNNKADFSFAGSCAGQSVTFTDGSSANVISRSWSFGDGTTSTEKDPSHTYTAAGSYNASLTIIFTDGCVMSVVKTLTISGATVSFTYGTSNACPPDYPITFISSALASSGTAITGYAWDFNNDGTTDNTDKDPTHLFNASGIYPVRLTVTTDNGCTNTFLSDVVIPKVAVDFSATLFQGCAPLNTSFTPDYSNTSDPILSYSWNFGDPASSANTSTLESPTHQYDNPGRYSVTLTVKTTRGCEITKTKTEYVKVGVPQAISGVTVDQSAYCLTNAAHFTASITTLTDSLVWNFSDGSVVVSQNNPAQSLNTISHNYPTPGNKSVTVQAYYNGCPSTSFTLNGVVINEPTANFTVSKSVACSLSDASFTFTDSSTGATSYSWDFGDGSFSGLKSPSHTYSTTGDFVVKLTVQNSTTGCSAEAVRTIRVVTANPSFTVNNIVVCAGTESAFTVVPNTSPNFIVDSYDWDFGETTNADNSSAIANPSHTYQTSGLYTVSLIVTEKSGCSYSYTLPNQMDVRGPIVDFTNDPKQICSGTEVSFTDQTTKATNDPATSNTYSWSFGDGGNSSDQNPKHTYNVNGNYAVNLQVTDNLGCVSSRSVNSSVLVPGVIAGFTTTRDTYCINDPVTFTDSSIGTIARYDWDLDGDGTYEIIDGAKDQTKTFTATGTYTVSKRVTSNLGCIALFSKTITVVDGTGRIVDSSGNLVPDYLVLGCAPISVDLIAQDPVSVVSSYSWDFGDGKTSDQRSNLHYYLMPGKYVVTLTETLTGGCTRTSSINIKVSGAYGKFSYTNTPACIDHTETFTASDLDGVTSLTWDFGGGSTETNSSPTYPATTIDHTYTTWGSRLPILILRDETCGDYSYYYGVDQRINTSEPPVAQFTSEADGGLTCEKLDFKFTDQSTRGNDTRYAVSTWNWDFGDGNTSTDQNPTHSYATAGDYTVTLAVTNGFVSGGCSSTVSHIVTANPLPLATITNGGQQICSGDNSINMVLGISNSLPGTTFDWKRDNPDGINSSTAASGTGLAIGDAITGGQFSNSNTAPVVVTYTVTPKGPSPTYCVGEPITATITVDPTPAVSSASAKTICNNSSVDYTIESLTDGTTFTWTASELTAPTGGNITGFSDGSGSDISQTLQNSGTTAGVVRYVITPKGPTPNFCPGTPFNFDVTVEPTPTATPSASSVIICSGSAPSLTVDVTVSNGRYLVQSISNPNGVSGVTTAPYTRADGETIDASTLSTTLTTKSVVYTIVPYTYGTNGIDNSGTGDDCLGSSFTVTVNVEPTPAATRSTATNRICNKTQPTATVNVTTINGNKYLVSSISNPME